MCVCVCVLLLLLFVHKIGGPSAIIGLLTPNPLGYMLVREKLSHIMMLGRNVLITKIFPVDDSFQAWIREVPKEHKKADGPSCVSLL